MPVATFTSHPTSLVQSVLATSDTAHPEHAVTGVLVTASSSPPPWVVDSRIDRAFLWSGLWAVSVLVALLVAGWAPKTSYAAAGQPPHPVHVVMFAAGALVLIPHFVASDVVWLGNRALWRADAQHGYRIAWANLAFAVAAVPLCMSLAGSPAGLMGLVIVQAVFELQHILAQDRGLLSIYRHRTGRGTQDRAADERLTHYLLAWTALNALLGPRSTILEGTATPDLLHHSQVYQPIRIVSHVILVVLVADVVRRPIGSLGWRGAAKVGYVASLLASCVLVATIPVLGFFALRLHHSAGYLALNFHLLRNMSRDRGVRGVSGLMDSATRSMLRFVLVLAVIALPLTVLTSSGSDLAGPRLAVAALLAFYFHHYFLDAFLWRFARPEIRDAVVPYLAAHQG